MRFTLIASALAALMGAPLAYADDPPAKSTTDTSTTTQSKDHATDQMAQMDPVNVLFDTDSATIKSDADADIAAAVDWAKCNPKAALIIEGHADPRGSQDHNLELSA